MIIKEYKYQNDIIDLPKLSEYNIENLYSIILDDTDGYYYNLSNTLSFPDVPYDETYDLYFPTGSESWTVISYRFYGTIKLWWLIASFNNIINPIDFPDSTTKLKIPKIEVVRYILDKINNK